MAVTVSQRRSHQRRITALLDELEQRRQRIDVLQARGARPAGLRDLSAELNTVRKELAAVVDAAGSAVVSARSDRPKQRCRPDDARWIASPAMSRGTGNPILVRAHP
jgi:hypothetical protein